jgi:hypothetical protein
MGLLGGGEWQGRSVMCDQEIGMGWFEGSRDTR